MKAQVALSLLLCSPSAFASSPESPPIECAPGWPTRCVVEIRAGEKARFDGQLMTPDLAIHLGQAAEGCRAITQAAVTATAAVAQEDKKRDDRIWRAKLRVVEIERDAWKRASQRPWLEHPVVVAGVTTGAISVVFGLALLVINAAKP